MWKKHLEPRVAQTRLRDFRTNDGEELMKDIARQDDLTKNSLKQVKSLLSGIFKHARRLGYIDSQNPMRDVSLPASSKAGRATGV